MAQITVKYPKVGVFKLKCIRQDMFEFLFQWKRLSWSETAAMVLVNYNTESRLIAPFPTIPTSQTLQTSTWKPMFVCFGHHQNDIYCNIVQTKISSSANLLLHVWICQNMVILHSNSMQECITSATKTNATVTWYTHQLFYYFITSFF